MVAGSTLNSSLNATLRIQPPTAASFLCVKRLATADGQGLIRLYHLSIFLCVCVVLTTVVARLSKFKWLKGFRTYTAMVNAHLAAAVALGLISDAAPMTLPESCALSLLSSCASTMWACFWMVHLYLSVGGSQVGKKFGELYVILGWGCPVIAVLLSMMVWGLTTDDICWAQRHDKSLQGELTGHGQEMAVAFPLLVVGVSEVTMLVIFALNLQRLCRISKGHGQPVLKKLKKAKSYHVLIFTVTMILLNAPMFLMRLFDYDFYGACTARAAYGLVPFMLFLGATDLVLKFVFPRPGSKPMAQQAAARQPEPRPIGHVTMKLEQRGEGQQLLCSGLKTLRIFTATFNAGNKPPSNMHELLPQDPSQTDLVVLATQECRKMTDLCPCRKLSLGWYKEVQQRLGEDFEFLATELMGRIGILVAIRREFKPLVRSVTTDNVGTGLLGIFLNKGAAAVRLVLGQSVLIFTSIHLNAFSEHMLRRHEDLKAILMALNKFSSTSDVQSESHHFFILGDLNFRLSPDPTAETKKENLKSREYTDFLTLSEQLWKQKSWEELATYDQLKTTMAQSKLLLGFREDLVTFDPTFKLTKQGGYKDTRVPSHTDRILTRSAHGHGQRLVQKNYTSGVEISNSDHRPVRGNFTLEVAEAKEQSQLLKVRIEELTVESSEILVEPLFVQGKIVDTGLWNHTQAVWSHRDGEAVSFPDGMSFEVCRVTAREKLVLFQVRRLACFGEEGDCMGVCALPLQQSDEHKGAEGDRYSFSAKLTRGSADVGILYGKLMLGALPTP